MQRRLRLTCALGVFLLIAPSLGAQQVTGRIVDQGSGQPRPHQPLAQHLFTELRKKRPRPAILAQPAQKPTSPPCFLFTLPLRSFPCPVLRPGAANHLISPGSQSANSHASFRTA